MIPGNIHQVDLSLKHNQVIGVGGSFDIVPAAVVGSTDLLLLIPNGANSFDVFANRVALGTFDKYGNPLPPDEWSTLTFTEKKGKVTADRGTVHDYDGDGIWTWHDDQYECGECAP